MKVFQNFPFRNTDGRSSLASLSERHKITPRRAGITIASAFAFVGIASAMNAGAANGSKEPEQPKQNHTIQLKLEKKDTSRDEGQTNITPPPATEQHVQSSVTLNQSLSSQNGSSPTTTNKVTVNGKDVPVPKNGTVKKVITDKNGDTSVHITSNTDGNANNASSSNISVNVTSDSTTSSSSNVDP